MFWTWIETQCYHTYYQLMILKIHFKQYWLVLDKRTKFCYIFSLLSCAGGLGYAFYKYVCMKEEECKKIYLEDFKEVKAISRRRRKGLPPGLLNEGNTCFANSSMHAISSSESFYQWICAKMSIHQEDELTVLPRVFQIVRVLKNITGNEDTYSLSDIFNSLRSHGWVITSEQQDAYEFFQILLSTLEEEIAKGPSNVATNICAYENEGDSTNIMSRVNKQLPSLLNDDVSSPFNLSFANKLSCLSCGYQPPVKFDVGDGLVLHLQNIDSMRALTLEHLLKKWHSSELIPNVACDKCTGDCSLKKYTTYTKQASFAKCPKCLCIQLQRTYYTKSGHVMKNPVHVTFPDQLDLYRYTYLKASSKPFETSKSGTKAPLLGGGLTKSVNVIRESPSRYRYNLVAVVLHFGCANDGHFACYKKFNKERWIYCSDELIKRVPKEEVFHANAYILLYEKCQ